MKGNRGRGKITHMEIDTSRSSSDPVTPASASISASISIETSDISTEDSTPGKVPQSRMRSITSYTRRGTALSPKLKNAWKKYASSYLVTFPSINETKERAQHWFEDKSPSVLRTDIHTHSDKQLSYGEDDSHKEHSFKRDMSVNPRFCFNEQTIEQIWGNTNPLIVEIGSGQGENIANAALNSPHINYLALEVFDQGVAHTLLRCGNYNISNLRIAQVDAIQFFACVHKDLLEEVWTYFPDPWPKMKHHKRRIIRSAFIEAVYASLKNDHLWRIATDIADYALHIHEEMSKFPLFMNEGTKEVLLPTIHTGKNVDEYDNLPMGSFKQSSRFEGRVMTSFEKKGIAAGHTIYDFTYRKVSAS